jgi:hypothetical protein
LNTTIQHHGAIDCTPFYENDNPIRISVLSGFNGPDSNKPDVTLQVHGAALQLSIDITPDNARALAARLITAANAGDGKAPAALFWDRSPPPETINPHTGLYHEPEAL